MAESAVVTDRLLVVAFGEWAAHAATLLARGAPDPVTLVLDGDVRDAVADDGPAPRLAVLVLSALEPDGGCARHARDARTALEEQCVTHLTVQRDGPSIWVGPTVVPMRPGCSRCWQARRRQHAGVLLGRPTGGGREATGRVSAPADTDSVRLAARAARAVARRVLESPEEEAGVIRRFGPPDAAPTVGRVIAVSGCARCDPPLPRPAGWSLRPGVTAGVQTTNLRKEVNT